MEESSTSQAHRDRLIVDQTSEPVRFRIVAAQAHSWSSLMLEDEHGGFHVLSVATALLTPLDHGHAERLLEERTYRPWYGDRSWAPLARLPLVSSSDPRSAEPPPVADDSAPVSGIH